MKTLLSLLLLISCGFVSHAANSVRVTDTAPNTTLHDFKLTGDLSGGRAEFILSATAKVENARGGSLNLLCGPVALVELGAHPKWRVRTEQNRYVLTFDRAGEFPIQLKFTAAVRHSDGWNSVEFQIAPGTLQPVTLRGLAADTQFQFPGGARPERVGTNFTSFLPSDGVVRLSWKESRPEAEGKLFYAGEMRSQISVSPGLMRQTALLDFKVMQGEMNRVVFKLRGDGEVTRVQGDAVLAWNVEGVSNSADRRLIVQLNQPQKDQFALQVQLQTSLGAFPQTSEAIQLQPEDATRFAGYIRVVNEGAVRLEVAQAQGMSQVSPEQFPENDLTRAALRVNGSQRFVYRFSGADFALRIQADQIQPEISASEVLAYHHGENELAIDAEIELDVREAPLRELLLRVPKNYAVARLNASGMSDYFVRDAADADTSELRLVYGQPVSGRQLVQLRLERNQSLGQTNWALPAIQIPQAKAVRGFIGASADAGFRLSTSRSESLSEIATAFFPRKVPNIQAAFRLGDPAWQATLLVERLPQTVQADVFHLFSIGEGVAYGSSIINYTVSGAPVSGFKVELSDEYFNVEFTGKDIRNWQRVEGGYVVQLHTPISGAYTLLASYERPFKAQGETLTFTGARPSDAASEQGHTLIISAYQFQVKPVDVSSGLLPLETAEVPAQYRLFFDAPILAAYRYAARPFNLKLALAPLAQGDSLNQVVDRASLGTQISKEGQVLTEARYFVKNRGNPNFRVTLPAGTALWSATVNGATVVPVIDRSADFQSAVSRISNPQGSENSNAPSSSDTSRIQFGDTADSKSALQTYLIPLPQRNDPDAVLDVQLKLATRSTDPTRVAVAAPVLAAPVMLAEWKLTPDAGQRLVYRHGSLTPATGMLDVSGFAGLARMFSADDAGRSVTLLFAAMILVGAALVVWRWSGREGTSRFNARHLSGFAVGLLALMLATGSAWKLIKISDGENSAAPTEISFLAPVQQSGSALTVEVSNIADDATTFGSVASAWPALLAVVVWFAAWRAESSALKFAGRLLGWMLLSWAALRSSNGAPAFFWILGAAILFELIVPSLRRLWSVPETSSNAPGISKGGASATAALLLCGLMSSGLGCANAAPSGTTRVARDTTPESVIQDVRIEERFAIATAKIRWQAEQGETLPLLKEPAVLTRLNYPTRSLTLIPSPAGSVIEQRLAATSSGTFDIEVQYQVQITKSAAESGFRSPLGCGLINRMALTVVNADVDVLSSNAVSVQRSTSGSNTVATLNLSPTDDVAISWKPRSRDLKSEKAVFYADLAQLYVPTAGVVEGMHHVAIRPAQGELNELVLQAPPGFTITDVADTSSDKLALVWRFDPDTRKLRVTLSPARSKPFALLVRSQVATGTLPVQHTVGLIRVEGAASQIGLLGVATGSEVQLDAANTEGLSAINLEDFPSGIGNPLQGQIAGLTVRRAFRYSDVKATAELKASAVEPDVRVETQNTLSLGEDRTVLAVNADVAITRAGVFRLSFMMPPGFDVETISGSALSHWTESKTDLGRAITLHLTGKTEGQRQFAISLAGPGVKATNGWTVPQLIIREASKQRGTLLVVPEQGTRLQAASRDGATQLDPEKSGIRQKGVLAFHLLQSPFRIALDVEQVEPWIQVTSLQQASLTEAQIKVAANLQYQIENTGLKTLRVLIPTNAESVRIKGEQVADFKPLSDSMTNGLQAWEVKLHRRVIGAYLLQVTCQTLVPEHAKQAALRGIEAADVNLQRGFVTVQSDPRLQVSVTAEPGALQPAEWQSIPRALQQDLPPATANLTYRLVDPSFELPLKLERHDAAKLLPARVKSVAFRSVISDDGVALTQAKLEILPGDKRLLNFTLPKDAHFWFAFVNQNGVWPWREQDRILIPLEQQSRGDTPVPVEIFYTHRIGAEPARLRDLELVAPKFDLPLENLSWRISLSDKWRVKHWTGSLQLQEEELTPQTASLDLDAYLAGENAVQQEKTKTAEEFMAAANSALEQGNPQLARRAFQTAFGLSTHDAAFNEDARVQLHNVKLQQALIGLSVRQSSAGGNASPMENRLREAQQGRELIYTQQDAKDMINRNTSDENAAFMRLAERLIQQQDAAVNGGSALRTSIPEEGRALTFKRAVVVDPWADLKIGLEIATQRTASFSTRVMILTFALIAFLAVIAGGRLLSKRVSRD